MYSERVAPVMIAATQRCAALLALAGLLCMMDTRVSLVEL
jgi:hypothetical protein